MIIRRIEVRNFRKLVEPVVIDGLGAGLTLIAGDNEEGKSTLVECVRTAFFVKHNIGGEFASSMQPYNSSVRPEVQIGFELDGKHYRLFKAYCQRPEAQLVTPNGSFSGSSAEEELGRLLRFSLPKRIRRDEQREHEGVFGMFWVEQGKSLNLEPNAAGRASIVEALQKEVGDVLGGKRGQRLIAEVRHRRDEILTSSGRSRGAYSSARQAVINLQAEAALVERQVIEHARSADELERCRGGLDQHRHEGTLEAARDRLVIAQHASEKIASLQTAAHDANTAFQSAGTRHQFAVERSTQRAHLVETLNSAEADLNEMAKFVETGRTQVSAARVELETAERLLVEAERQLKSVERELKHTEATDLLVRARVRLSRLQEDHAAGNIANQEHEVSLALANSITVQKPQLCHLRELRERVAATHARLEASATQCKISVVPGAKVLLDGQPVVGEECRTLTRATVIEAPGCVRLSIFPGTGIGDPQDEFHAATRNFDEMLRRLGAKDFADAEDQFERRSAALNRADASAKLLAAYAPQGLQELPSEIASTATEIEALEQLVAAGQPIENADLASRLQMLRERRDEATDAVKARRREVECARSKLNEVINAETAGAAKHSHQEELCRQYRDRLKSERLLVSDEHLEITLLEAVREAKAAEVTVAAAHRTLEEANPDAIAEELRMATTAHRQIENDIEALRERAIRLESELRISGGLGLGERRDELQGRLAAAQRELARIEQQAKTLDLLLRVLLDAEAAAKEQFLGPVTERVGEYLKILLPGTQLAFNEDINMVGLRRGPMLEPFEMLSVGTREQLAVLTRLAFAELLREHGHPAAVLLDDAIVFADERRFERMLRILNKAAEKLQVIVLTCRERDYRASNASIIRLADCRVQASAAN